MGRRAKNKQGDPAPFSEVQENAGRPSQKKLDKRKADEVDSSSKRPTKKAKEIDIRPGKSARSPAPKGKEKNAVKGEAKAKAGEPKKQQARFEEDEGAGGSEVWEDVEDDGDLQTQAQCVRLKWDSHIGTHIVLPVGHYSAGATKTRSLDSRVISTTLIWMAWTKSTYISEAYLCSLLIRTHSDDLMKGPVQELDLWSDDEDEEELPAKLRNKKSKQADRPLKIIPTASDASSDDSDGDEDGPITMKNIEVRSRALDAKAAREAQLDIEEMQEAALAGEESGNDFADADMDEEGDRGEGTEEFVLPTAEEREEEKKRGGPDVHTVQRRMRECVRLLGNLKRLAAKGRCVHFSS